MSKDDKSGILVRYSSAIPPVSVLIAVNSIKDALAKNNITLKLVAKNTKDPVELTLLPSGYRS